MVQADQLAVLQLILSALRDFLREDILAGQTAGTGLLAGQGGGARERAVGCLRKEVDLALGICKYPDEVGDFLELGDQLLQWIVLEIEAEGLQGVCLDDIIDLHVCICTRDSRKLGVRLR